MSKKLLTAFALTVLALGAGGCATSDQMANANVNAAATTTTRTLADGSEITTTIDANGVKTETRVFRNNPRVSRVVVTTRDGRRTVRAYSPKGEEKEINDIGDALEATGDKIADGAGWVADKTEDVVDEAADKLEDVGDKTASGAKKVGRKTVQGAKKTGSAIKDAVTP